MAKNKTKGRSLVLVGGSLIGSAGYTVYKHHKNKKKDSDKNKESKKD